MTKPQAVDLFAGAGGATQGLRNAGFEVVGAVENEPDAAESYRLNHPDVMLVENDIRKVAATTFRDRLGLQVGELSLLKACPPCQGFSTLASGRGVEDSDRNDLVNTVTRFVRAFRPNGVLIENVPGLERNFRFAGLVQQIEGLGYKSRSYIVNATDFGVPQRRRRLIVIAVRGRRSILPEQLTVDGDIGSIMVRDAFDALRSVVAPNDPLSVSRKSSQVVVERIKAIPVGGNRFDLPEEHRLSCHNRVDSRTRGATASYGRIKLDQPAPTMTTRCTTPACGSFIHPTEDRGITLREAATLQTFPANYQFAGTYGSIERQIGNAVPVRMAEALGRTVRSVTSAATMASST